jgi:hypothetical protein
MLDHGGRGNDTTNDLERDILVDGPDRTAHRTVVADTLGAVWAGYHGISRGRQRVFACSKPG